MKRIRIIAAVVAAAVVAVLMAAAVVSVFMVTAVVVPAAHNAQVRRQPAGQQVFHRRVGAAAHPAVDGHARRRHRLPGPGPGPAADHRVHPGAGQQPGQRRMAAAGHRQHRLGEDLLPVGVIDHKLRRMAEVPEYFPVLIRYCDLHSVSAPFCCIYTALVVFSSYSKPAGLSRTQSISDGTHSNPVNFSPFCRNFRRTAGKTAAAPPFSCNRSHFVG